MDSVLDTTVRLVDLLAGLATFATLAWGLARMFRRAAEAKVARDEQSAAISSVAEKADQLVVQTNGMSHRLQQMSEAAGKMEGREEMRVEQAAEKAKE